MNPHIDERKPDSADNAGDGSSGVPKGRTEGHRPARWLAYAGILLFLGAMTGGLLLKDPIVRAATGWIPDPNSGRKVLYWTSPHDLSVHSDKPGKTPMGMDLVPVYEGGEVPKGSVVIDPVVTEREYATVAVQRGPLVRALHAVSTVDYAEPRIGDVTLKIDAWLEKLYVDYEGQAVRRGDPLFEVYSPRLVTTQEEFLVSRRAWQQAQKRNSPLIVETTKENLDSVRSRLAYWDVTDEQIDDLAKTGKVRKTLTFYSPFDGIVTEKHAFEGKYVPAGQLLYRVADLSKVWVYVFVYQNQLHCVYEGQGATLRLPNLPGHVFRGKVVYVYPYLEPKSRAAKVRLEFDNPELLLKPGMYAQVQLEPHRMGVGLKVPEQVVLRTGERDLVYVALPDHKFQARPVTTGMELDGGMVHVIAGLQEGNRVVMEPSLLMDSESRLRAVDRRFGPAPKWTEQTPPMQMPSMKMPPMKMPAENGSPP